jgi:OOP family OmpA-OmpF porin
MRLYNVEVIARLLYDVATRVCLEMNVARTVFALVFTLIVSAAIPTLIFAEVKPAPVTLGGFSLTPTIGGYLFARSEQRNTTPLYGLKFGYDNIAKSIANSLGVEATLNYFSASSKTVASGATGYLFRLDAIYPFIMGAKWMPFLAVGGGGIVIDTPTHAERNPLFNYGAGLKYFFEDYLALRADARQLIVYNNNNTHNNFELSVGLSYYFGKERKKIPQPISDADQDGVPDSLDRCPNTPKGVEVDKNGCTADSIKTSAALPTQTVMSVPVPAAEKTGTAAVEPSAAPAQLTEFTPATPDAVSEQVSQAVTPATPPLQPASTEQAQPAPVKGVDSVRQTVEKNAIRKLTLEFDLNSFYTKPHYHKKLRELARIMKISADASALIEGHTDSTGELSYNIQLSKQRAQSVRNSLIKLGVDPDRISTMSYGPSRPIADNVTTAGGRKNRRAVIIVTYTAYEQE